MIERIRQWSARLSGRQGDPPWLGAIGVSAVVHAGLIFILAALLTIPHVAIGPSELAGDWADMAPVKIDMQEIERPSTEPDRAQSNGGMTSGHLVAMDRKLSTQPVQVRRDNTPAPEFPFDDPEFVRTLGQPVRSKSSGRGSGNGSGDGDGGIERGLGFFGDAEPGKSYAYVLDCSRSMNYPHGGEWKSRMKRLKAELVRSVGTLGPENRFIIIFFNDEPRPMPARGLEPAHLASQKRYLKWAIDQKPDGKTKPTRALRLALKLNPDVIYFLTDGQFEPKVRRILKNIKQGRTAIHTYALGNQDSEKILRELATANGGKYHFIP